MILLHVVQRCLGHSTVVLDPSVQTSLERNMNHGQRPVGNSVRVVGRGCRPGCRIHIWQSRVRHVRENISSLGLAYR